MWEHEKRSMAFRTLLDAGIHAAAGSDFSPGPFDPRMAIQGMVTRTGWDGKTWGLQAEQQLPVQAGASAAFDVRSQRAILFGGAGAQAVDCRPMTPGAGMAPPGLN